MDILKQIQSDLLKQDVSLSTILRKAKVLASQLRSDDLQDWVSQELDGYKSFDDLPDYRILKTGCVGNWTNGYWMVRNQGVPIHRIENEKLVERLTTFPVFDGVRTVEQYTLNKEQHFTLPPDMTSMVNYYVGQDGYGFASIELALGKQDFEQLLDTVKNRLLDFVLKLNEDWHVDDKPPSKDEVRNLVSVIIYNHQKGGDMSVFDQRGQQVNYQYNAAGNINIHSGLSKNELADELEKLRGELERAKEVKAIDQDTAVEAEYHLMQASKEARKDKPDKGSFLKHVEKTKTVLEGVNATSGLITALVKAAELASKLFS